MTIRPEHLRDRRCFGHFLLIRYKILMPSINTKIRTLRLPAESSDFSCLVEHRGVEPLTSTMRMSRATEACVLYCNTSSLASARSSSIVFPIFIDKSTHFQDIFRGFSWPSSSLVAPKKSSSVTKNLITIS